MDNLIAQEMIEEAVIEYSGQVGLIVHYSILSGLLDNQDIKIVAEIAKSLELYNEVRFMFACFILLMAGEKV